MSFKMISRYSLAIYLCALLCATAIQQDFIYKNFEVSKGIVLDGDATITNCRPLSPAVKVQDPTSINAPYKGQHYSIKKSFPSDSFASTCQYRLRLTPSRPYQSAYAQYHKPISIFQGFTSDFTFQITSQTRQCYNVYNRDNGGLYSSSCHVRGGDGFAFVMRGNKGNSIKSGQEPRLTLRHTNLGYHDITNAIAIEFDTVYGPEHSTDTLYDHVMVLYRGLGMDSYVPMTAPAQVSLADGKVHFVRIRYFNTIEYELLPYFTVTSDSKPYLMDLSESRRIGTLAVYLDHAPILALPINLATALVLETDRAFLGFTASTSKIWQNQDILEWRTQQEVPNKSNPDHSGNGPLQQEAAESKLPSLSAQTVFLDTRPWSSSNCTTNFYL